LRLRSIYSTTQGKAAVELARLDLTVPTVELAFSVAHMVDLPVLMSAANTLKPLVSS
jgi:hypothetical protein